MLGLAFIYRNRSGYQGCTFMVDGNIHESISEKSREYASKREEALKLPIVVFDNMEIVDVLRLDAGGYTIQYQPHNMITNRTIKSVGKWYIDNGLHFDTISYTESTIYVHNAKFK